MKKLVLIGIVFALVSCGEVHYSVSMVNNSEEKTVSYTYNGVSDTIEPATTKSYEVKAYTQPPADIADQNKIASITMTQKGDLFTFDDAKFLGLNVVNTLSVPIKIKAGNYIDADGLTEIEIDANKNKTARIYTSKPNFTSLTNYPVVIDWNITEDAVYAVIR